jgi:hypothetical protein
MALDWTEGTPFCNLAGDSCASRYEGEQAENVPLLCAACVGTSHQLLQSDPTLLQSIREARLDRGA